MTFADRAKRDHGLYGRHALLRGQTLVVVIGVEHHVRGRALVLRTEDGTELRAYFSEVEICAPHRVEILERKKAA